MLLTPLLLLKSLTCFAAEKHLRRLLKYNMSRQSFWVKHAGGKIKLESRSRHEKRLTKRKSHYILIVKGVGAHKDEKLIKNKGPFNEYLSRPVVGSTKLRRKGEAYPFTAEELEAIHQRQAIQKITIHSE